MILTGNIDGVKTHRAMSKKAKNQASARERVFRSAAELFHRRGIRAVGVETIAAQARATKMSLYRNFPSKDELVAEWLRDHDARFWQAWDAMSREHPDDARRQLKAAFDLLAKHVADPKARGCPMANAAVEITESDHPATKVIEAHKGRLRGRLAELCARIGAGDPRLLADQLFLLMEGAQVSAQTPGARTAAASVARAAAVLIDAHIPAR
jgi:AcrR family transcriptional regulator